MKMKWRENVSVHLISLDIFSKTVILNVRLSLEEHLDVSVFLWLLLLILSLRYLITQFHLSS